MKIDWGKALKTHREIAGMTQTELAEKIGVASRTVGFWETGDRGMTLKHAIAAFDVLGCEFVLKARQK